MGGWSCTFNAVKSKEEVELSSVEIVRESERALEMMRWRHGSKRDFTEGPGD